MSVRVEKIHTCDRCGNAFDTGGPDLPRTMSVDAKVYTGGSGSWPSDNRHGYCEPCTEVIEKALKPIVTPEDERVYPDDIIKTRRLRAELAEHERKRDFGKRAWE